MVARKTRHKEGLKEIPPIEHPRIVAASFAIAVTARVADGSCYIARRGDQSLFRTLQRILPRIIQPECKGRRFRLKGKITAPEFNKLLQESHDFLCSRTRKRPLARAAGNWLFSNRRWLSPADPSEKSILEANYDKLCSLHPEFCACSKDDFLRHLTDVTSAWAKVLSECSMLPIYPGNLPGSATESEIHEGIEALQNKTLRLLATKRRRASAEDESPRPKTARKERRHDSPWLGCMQDAGRHAGMAQLQQNLPGGIGTLCREAYPIAQQPRGTLPPPSAFTPRSMPRANRSGPCTGASGPHAALTEPRATTPGADPCPAGASAPGMAALRPPRLADCGCRAAQEQPPQSTLPAATAHSASGAASLLATTTWWSWSGLGPLEAPLEPALAVRTVAGAAGPSALTSLDRLASAFTAVVRPNARPPTAAPTQRPLLHPSRASPTLIQSAVTAPQLRGAAPPHVGPPDQDDRPHVWFRESEPAAYPGGCAGEGTGGWPDFECGCGACRV